MMPLLLVAVLLGGWELYADLGGVDEFILPAPSQIAAALWDDRSLLWDNLLVTAEEVGLGLLAGARARLRCSPSRCTSRARCAAASTRCSSPRRRSRSSIIAPLLVVWFGFGLVPKLVIIALVCFFPIVVTTLDALRSRRPRSAQAAAHARRLALAGVPLGRGARRAARPRSAAPRSRSPWRSSAPSSPSTPARARASATSSCSRSPSSRPRAPTPRSSSSPPSPSLLFGALALAERRLVPWADRRPEGPARDPPPPARPARPRRRRCSPPAASARSRPPRRRQQRPDG